MTSIDATPHAQRPSGVSRALWRFIGFLSFHRVTIVQRQRLPRGGPVLYVGLHRNGAMDGVPYLRVAPRATTLVSAQLQRHAIGRLVFAGIPVARTKDRRRGIGADNDASLRRCVAQLVSGGELLVLPEGTSSLGPRHLPFKSGAARIAEAVLAQGVALTVVPLALHYECAWEWQSNVEVAIGEPFVLSPESHLDRAAIHERIGAALESVGVNVESESELRLVEMLAYAATLGTGHSYSTVVKQLAAGVPSELRQAAEELRAAASAVGLRRHQGVPLVPVGSPLPYAALWCLLAPFMTLFVFANLPVFIAATIAARKLPDDVNVVAFWRAAIGIPVGIVWSLTLVVALSMTLGVGWALLYLVGSLAMVRLHYRFRKLSIALYNFLRAPRFRPRLLAFQKMLLEALA